MKHISLTSIIGIAVVGVFNCTYASASEGLKQAVEAIGGVPALTEMTHFQLEVKGNRRTNFEAPQPDGLMEASTYEATYRFDLDERNLRVDASRTPLFEGMAFLGPSSYTIVLNGEVGGISDQVGFIPPGNLWSEAAGGLTTQQRLLNPHIYLREALQDQSLVRDAGTKTFNNREHRVVAFKGKHAEILLLVESETGLISKLETLENHPLVRDISIEVVYSDWSEHGSVRFPGRVELFTGGLSVQDEVRVAVDSNPIFDENTFDLPDNSDNPVVDTDALVFGQKNHQVMQAFFSMGFMYNQSTEISQSDVMPGVTLLTNSMANSLVISHEEGLVVLEAPASPAHGDNIIAELGRSHPGVSITHLIQSHHHEDHSGGLRSFVANGATAVVGHGVGDFWNSVFAAASTIEPDTLSAVDVAPAVEEIPLRGRFELDDGVVKITAYHVPENEHAIDMLITAVERDEKRVVFVSDLYNAGYGFTVVTGGPDAFFAIMRSLGIIDQECKSEIPLTIVPAHGVALALTDAIAELAEAGIDIACPSE